MSDDTAISSLYVELGLDTVGFQKGGDEAARIAQKTAGDIDKSFGSMAEGRGGLMLAEDAIGVRLPRHLNTLLAKMPAVSAAFSAILPIAGVAVAIEIVGKLIEKHDALAAASRKAATESANLAIRMDDSSKSMELANLKLDDQIAKLSGGVNVNRLKEALLESGLAADKLAASFATDFEKINEELLKSTTSIGTMKSELSLIASDPISLFAGQSPKAKVDEINAALKLLTSQMLNVQTAQRNLDKAGSLDEQVKALKQMQLEYRALGEHAEAALKVVEKDEPDNAELLQHLSQEWTTAETAVKNFGLQVEETQKRVQVAGLENVANASAVYEAQMKGLEHYKKIEADYAKAHKERVTKALEENEKEKKSEMDATDAFDRMLAHSTEAAIKRNEELRESYVKLDEERSKAAVAAKVSSVDTQASLGVISAKDEQQQLKAIYLLEETDLKAHYDADKAEVQAYIDVQQTLANSLPTDSALQLKALDAVTKAQVKLNDETRAYEQQMTLLNNEVIKVDASLQKDTASWDLFFAKMSKDTQDIGTQVRVNLQESMDKAFSTIGEGFAKLAVEGKSFSAAMKSLGNEIAESFISMLVKIGLQWLLSHLMMQADTKLTALDEITSAAAVAGAEGTASMAGAVYPLSIGAPAFGASMMAAAMTYAAMLPGASGGALIDGTESTPTPVMAHGKELILPAHLSQGLQNMISKGSGGSVKSTVINQHFDIQTPSPDSFGASQSQITQRGYAAAQRAAMRNS